MDVVKVGTILMNSWGYDQTNWDFYQVVKVGSKSITIRQIDSKKDYNPERMTGLATPIKDKFIGESMVKRLSYTNGILYVRLENGFGRVWDGKAKGYSDYA